jgi:CheY-like chemotaxis protein
MASQTIGDSKDHPKSLRVLVADDNKDGANALGYLLESWGYDVRVVYDGQAALKLAQTHPLDVALIDLGLPAMDGYQVAVHLRRRPELKSLKLIAVTGFEWANARQRSEEYGFNDHLVKPIDLDQLRALMTQIESTHISEADRNPATVEKGA